MRKSRRVAVAVGVSGLVAAGGITFGLIAHANSQAFCDSAGAGTSQSPITCTLPGTTGDNMTINTPSAVQAIVILNSGDNVTPADQYVAVTYSMFCSEGGNEATTTNTTSPALPAEQAITTSASVTDTLVFSSTTPTPDSCTITALTATLEAGASAATATPTTTGSFELELAYTPAASSSTATATSSTSSVDVSYINGYDGKCLDDKGNFSNKGTKVIIWGCNHGDSAQGWTFSNGELQHNGKCANIQGGGGSGSKLILWSCTGASNEKWSHSSSGEYVSAETGHGLLCVDDPGYSKSNGTQLIVYTCHNSSNQHWAS